MARVLLGTCSWTDPTLLASGFYPGEASTPEKRLRFYASCFPLVEVDSSYYAIPSETTVGLWARRTPETFVFDVKAFRAFTHHPTPPEAFPKPVQGLLASPSRATLYYRDLPEKARELLWRSFEAALLPLFSAGKLGVVLFQFPPWFRPTPGNRDYILRCQEKLPQYRLAIEFRNAAWLDPRNREETFRFLRENHLAYVAVDQPQGFPSSVPPVAEATSEIAVVRFHGRNRENWEKAGISVTERFRYLYSEEELREWVPRIGRLASQAKEVHVLFNNCYSNWAVRNAQDMRKLLASRGMKADEVVPGPSTGEGQGSLSSSMGPLPPRAKEVYCPGKENHDGHRDTRTEAPQS